MVKGHHRGFVHPLVGCRFDPECGCGEQSSKGNPSLVYLELWARSFDEGMVEIVNEDDCAYAAGYRGTRAERTWREHILQLEEVGFIKTKPRGNREIVYVLLLHPLAVCARLYADNRFDVPEEWWTAFVHRVHEIGAKIPHDD